MFAGDFCALLFSVAKVADVTVASRILRMVELLLSVGDGSQRQ